MTLHPASVVAASRCCCFYWRCKFKICRVSELGATQLVVVAMLLLPFVSVCCVAWGVGVTLRRWLSAPRLCLYTYTHTQFKLYICRCKCAVTVSVKRYLCCGYRSAVRLLQHKIIGFFVFRLIFIYIHPYIYVCVTACIHVAVNCKRCWHNFNNLISV